MKGIQGTSNKTYRMIMGNGLRYEIPKFQRDYSWGTENWDDLWQDIQTILEKDEDEHYMGYLVLQTNNNKLFRVIDGQQRLTTLSILILSVLKALNDLIEKDIEKENNKIRIKSFRESYIGFLNPVTLISENKLKLNRNSDEYFRSNMVLLKDLPIRNTNSSEKHMRECFKWFYPRVKRQFVTGAELAGFIDTIVDKLFFTVIEVTDQVNAFKVFETLNARGVQLSSSDLLKNYFFSIIDSTNPPVSEIEEVEKLWSSIIGKLGSKKFEDFLRYFWNSYNKTVRKAHLFKTIKKEIVSKRDVFHLIHELRDTADLYIAIQDPENEFWSENEYLKVKPYLKELKLFQIKQTNSLLLAGFRNLDSRSFIKLVKICSIISFRYNIIGGLNPNEQEDVYNKIANKISSTKEFPVKDFQSIYVTDDSFKQYFSTKTFKRTNRNHKIVKYVFSKLEYYLYNNEINSESDIYTIEHILPESADENWGSFSNEEIDRSIFRLGNLTLLEKRLNKDAGVLAFNEKKKFFKDSNSKLTNAIVGHYDIWTESKISQRQNELAKAAKSIWTIQGLE